MADKARPRKNLPDWTKKTPDVVTVNPGPSTTKNFVHTPPTPQHDFTKKSSGSSVTMPLGSLGTVLNASIRNRKKR